jgi:Skp family chaperone for outer membrane proteins
MYEKHVSTPRWIVGLLGLVLLSSFTYAEIATAPPGPKKSPPVIAPENREQVKQLMENQKQIHQQMQSIHTKQKQLMEGVRAGSLSKDSALNQAQQIHTELGGLAQKRIENTYALRALLGPEGMAKLQARFKERHSAAGKTKP